MKALATPALLRAEEMGPHFRKIYLPVGGFEICLHHFTGPDLYEPHDHPLPFITSILAGGYREEVWIPGEDHQWVKQIHDRLPGTSHRVEATTVHRIVQVFGGECITSVIWLADAGQKRREPRFWKPWETPTVSRRWDQPDGWTPA